MSEMPPFIRPLPSSTSEPDEPLELDPDVRAELDRKLRDIRESHAAAMGHGNYVVWR